MSKGMNIRIGALAILLLGILMVVYGCGGEGAGAVTGALPGTPQLSQSNRGGVDGHICTSAPVSLLQTASGAMTSYPGRAVYGRVVACEASG